MTLYKAMWTATCKMTGTDESEYEAVAGGKDWDAATPGEERTDRKELEGEREPEADRGHRADQSRFSSLMEKLDGYMMFNDNAAAVYFMDEAGMKLDWAEKEAKEQLKVLSWLRSTAMSKVGGRLPSIECLQGIYPLPSAKGGNPSP